MLRWLFATLHLLALGIGLGAVGFRARGFRQIAKPGAVEQVLVADTWWGIAAILWIATGLVRFLMGLEKPTSFYLANHLFWGKMTLLVLILLLELGPMMALIRWRIARGKGQPMDLSRAPHYATVSMVEAFLIVAMVSLATAMARGYTG